MIEKFITFKDPIPVEDRDGQKGGILFRTHVLLTDGRNLIISDAQHGEGAYKIDETLAFPCDASGNVTEWVEVSGGRFMRTEDVVVMLNSAD